MYWRVRNLGPAHLLSQYGIHIGLAVSLLFNMLLFVTRPSKGKGVTQTQKKSFEDLAKDVTTQLLDTSYINYVNNTDALINHRELDPKLIQKMQSSDLLPSTSDDLRARARQLAEEKMVAAVRIDSISTGDANQQGFVPVDVAGLVAVHSASGADEKAFRMKYFVGEAPTGNQIPADSNKYSHYSSGNAQTQAETIPMIADYQELPPDTPMPPSSTASP